MFLRDHFKNGEWGRSRARVGKGGSTNQLSLQTPGERADVIRRKREWNRYVFVYGDRSSGIPKEMYSKI